MFNIVLALCYSCVILWPLCMWIQVNPASTFATSCVIPFALTARSNTVPSPISPIAPHRKLDGKKGKRQIVIGLLCNAQGQPLSIEVFTGNTNDTATMASQIRKVVERFGGGEVTFVGDRGMIRGRPIEDLAHRVSTTSPQSPSHKSNRCWPVAY